MAKPVRKAMDSVLRRIPGNASSLHTHGRKARGLMDTARKSIAEMLNCQPEQIFFTSGGTEGNNAVIKGVFSAKGKGHIITSKIEHESILGACCQVEKRGGRITYLPADKQGQVDPEAVRAAISEDTILISIMHANNETGIQQPLEKIAAIAKECDIPLHTDAVQTFGNIETYVEKLGCEFLTLSAHKINGPKGVGAIFCRGNTPWEALIYGGDQEHKKRAGTEGIHQIVGLGTAVRLAKKKMQAELARLTKIRNRFLDKLRQFESNIIVNESDPETQLPGTINVTFPEYQGIHLLAGLDCYEVSVSIGSACTADRIEPSHVLLGMGVSEEHALSTIRMSMGRTTSWRDMHYVWEVFKAILKGLPEGFSYLDPQHLTKELVLSDDTFLIDLRWPYERMLAPTIPGAVEYSPVYFERFHKKIPWDKTVILMCATGILSFPAGYKLAKRKHPKVRVVYGGYTAWGALYPDMIQELKAGL